MKTEFKTMNITDDLVAQHFRRGKKRSPIGITGK